MTWQCRAVSVVVHNVVQFCHGWTFMLVWNLIQFSQCVFQGCNFAALYWPACIWCCGRNGVFAELQPESVSKATSLTEHRAEVRAQDESQCSSSGSTWEGADYFRSINQHSPISWDRQRNAADWQRSVGLSERLSKATAIKWEVCSERYYESQHRPARVEKHNGSRSRAGEHIRKFGISESLRKNHWKLSKATVKHSQYNRNYTFIVTITGGSQQKSNLKGENETSKIKVFVHFIQILSSH